MKIKFGDVEKTVERVQITQAGEPWSEHLLEDGHVLRMRTIVTAVYRVVGELTPLGRPIYHVEHNTVMDVQ